jgi:DNA-binding response OmpR family regulator
MRILVAEDHPSLGPDVKVALERCRYVVDLVANGEDARSLGLVVAYDLLILDILLPGLSGWEVCQQLRAQHKQMPILFLTALSQVDDRVKGLDLGADDYLSKPFAFRELEARVRALLRRNQTSKDPVLRFLDIALDTRSGEVRRGDRVITLSGKEYALLHVLLSHPRQVLSRTTIADHLWSDDADHFSNVIDVYISYLRAKLCAAGEPNVIQTIRGAGYRLTDALKTRTAL